MLRNKEVVKWRGTPRPQSFADLESGGEDERDKDDEFFDALSQQLCNSTLILDCEPDGTEATGQSQEGSFALDKSHEESFLSTEPIGKNVLILLSADSLFKYDKTSFSDYEQFFRENIFKILQRFFHSQPQSTIVKSFSLPLGLICDLQTQMSQVSEKNIGHARYRSRDIFDSEPLEFGSHTVAMSTAALFMPKQPSYSQSVEEVSTDIERYIKNLKSEIGDYVDFEVSVICDNLASVLFHDILTGFSPASKVNQKMPNISVCDAFPISNVYYLGSSLGFVLSFYGRGNQSRLTFPLYNLFFAEDSCSARLEPILIGQNEQLTDDSRDLPFKLTSYQDLFKRGSERHRKLDVFPDIQGRSDLQLWSGEGEDEEFIELVTRVRGTHALYWESFDVAFFILSNFTSHSVYTHNHYTNDNTVQQESHGLMSDSVGMEGRDTAEFSILNDFFTDADSRERERERATADMSALQRRKFDHNLDEMADSDAEGSSARKAKSFPPMHVLNDMAITVGNEAMIIGRFGYRVGVFVSKLSRETIELDFRNEVGDEANSDWSKIGQIHTGSKGRVMFNFTRSAELKQGLYSVRALCPGDLSRAKATLCVLPPRGVQAVLFSIDGTFADSVSLTGSNSKLRSSSVELVRFWSALGYLVVYASARPNIMKERVKSWLDAHGFPPSICLFVEGLSTPEKNMTKKANLLKQLKENLDLTYFAAYGSQKDLAMYLKLGITQERLFIFPDRLAASPRSKNVAQSLANCEIISKNGIPAHVANLRLKSKQLTSKSPLHFAIQSSRKSATDFPRAKTSSLTVTGSNNEFVCISEDSCNLPEVSMPTAPNSKSPRLREKLLGTIQSITKRDTQLSLTESRQSKHDLKQP